jgi:purine-nucleoside phosphorylase
MELKVNQAVEKIVSQINVKPELGMILGSGLGDLVTKFKHSVTIKFEDIPHFPKASVQGHNGEIVTGLYEGVQVMAASGRVHYYEGYSMRDVCFSVKVLAGCGVKRIIVTNAAGAVNRDLSLGDIVAIKDHINFMGDNPLIGNPDFIDMTEVYSKRLIKLAREAAHKISIDLKEGVYMAFSGPSYETPAEVNMASILGADMAGMSTVPEVIVANQLGLEVLGLSMITNMASGITQKPLSHDEVIQVAQKITKKFKGLIKEIVSGFTRER